MCGIGIDLGADIQVIAELRGPTCRGSVRARRPGRGGGEGGREVPGVAFVSKERLAMPLPLAPRVFVFESFQREVALGQRDTWKFSVFRRKTAVCSLCILVIQQWFSGVE